MAADFHTAFNLVLALVFILPLGPGKAAERFLPERAKPKDPSTPLYLDESALGDTVGGLDLRGARDAAYRRYR
jgi:phosphate:Na+ symporter